MELLLLIAAMTGCSKTGPVALPAAEAPAPTLEELAMHNPAAATTDWPIAPNQDDWPWWRGLNQDGRATQSAVEPPLTWGPTENVVWQAPLSGRGHASPVLWGETLLLANADEEAQTQSLLALSRMDGKPLWNTIVHRGELPSRHDKNSHASATPACDGRQVYAAFVTSDGLWVTALNFAGEIAWQTKAGPFSIEHGYGSSPVLYESLVIVAGDNQGPGYLAAFDRATGEMVWRTPRTEHSSYGTPILATLGDRAQLLHSGGNVTAGYDPKTGQQIWKCAGPTRPWPTPWRSARDLFMPAAATLTMRFFVFGPTTAAARRAKSCGERAKGWLMSPLRWSMTAGCTSSMTTAFSLASRPSRAQYCGKSGWEAISPHRQSRPMAGFTSPPKMARRM
jgi:predicted small lipoprotein YifL